MQTSQISAVSARCRSASKGYDVQVKRGTLRTSITISGQSMGIFLKGKLRTPA